MNKSLLRPVSVTNTNEWNWVQTKTNKNRPVLSHEGHFVAPNCLFLALPPDWEAGKDGPIADTGKIKVAVPYTKDPIHTRRIEEKSNYGQYQHPQFRLIQRVFLGDGDQGARYEVWASHAETLSRHADQYYYPARCLLVRLDGDHRKDTTGQILLEGVPIREYRKMQTAFSQIASQYARQEVDTRIPFAKWKQILPPPLPIFECSVYWFNPETKAVTRVAPGI